MKKILRGKYSASFALSFILSFMLFVYEPLVMYANNTKDFWFDVFTLSKMTFFPFIGAFVGLSAVLVIAKKLLKPKISAALYLAVFAGFFIAYINSNYLAGFLPALDGTNIVWDNKAGQISSIAVIIVTLAAAIFSFCKFGAKKTERVASYISLAIFAMLSVSLLSTIATTPLFKNKSSDVYATEKDINKLSSNENFLILMLDATDSKMFQDIIDEDADLQKTLKDFSYYPDTTCGYSFTRESVPFIFSGEWFENTEKFENYSTRAYTESAFFTKLRQENYKRTFYDDAFIWSDESALEFTNLEKIPQKAKKRAFIIQEIKYVLFKTLPYPLKRYSKIDTMNFPNTRVEASDTMFFWQNPIFHNDYLKRPVEKIDEKYFQFMHIEGGHVPYNLDENGNAIDEEADGGTYERKLKGTTVILKEYIEHLKNEDAYDNSTIVIMADHGFDPVKYSLDKRSNPILYIKGKGETHSKMHVSKKQVSQLDLVQAFSELVDGKKSTEIFSEIPEEGRVRRYMEYWHQSEDKMQEYEQYGNAWSMEGLKPTGKEFNQ